MPHVHKSTTYKPGVVPNPFQEGQDRAYADILLDKINEAKAWRMTSVVHGVLFVLSIIIFVIALASQKTVPVLINVMPTGEAAYLGEVRQTGTVEVPQSAIIFQIRTFITNFRSVSIDGEVLYNNINECYAMATTTYEPVMTNLLRSASPFELVGRIRRTVEIESVIHRTENSYQIDWTETTLETGSGSTPRTRKLRGLITVRLIPPNDSFIKTNPLGIFIDACEWDEI